MLTIQGEKRTDELSVRKVKAPRQGSYSRSSGTTRPKDPKDCHFCGSRHILQKELCPAWGKTCSKCKGKNHFAIKCKSRIHALQTSAEAHITDDDQSFDDAWLATVSSGWPRSTALLSVNGQEVRFQLDTAADVNTICHKYVRRDQVQPSSQRLIMWNGTKMIPKGETVLQVFNPKTATTHDVRFTIVQNQFTCLLGLETVKRLKFVTINDDKFISNLEISGTLGDLGEAHLSVDPSKKPKQMQCRRIPFALEGKAKSEIGNHVNRGILAPVTEPTEWVSQMAIAEKSNGDI
ncbi:transposon Ty3-I Gag-Pol polyprotein, partial [Elysia marginata]